MKANGLGERQTAKAAGLSFHFNPVALGTITEADIHAFQNSVSAVEGSVVAHCRSKIRSATLFAVGEVLDGRVARWISTRRTCI